MARPKKSMTERRNSQVIFRCTDKEYLKLLERAEQANKSVNSYARQASLSSTVRIIQDRKLDFEARQKLRILNTNINQIAHSLNATGQHVPDELNSAIALFNQFWDEVLPSGS